MLKEVIPGSEIKDALVDLVGKNTTLSELVLDELVYKLWVSELIIVTAERDEGGLRYIDLSGFNQDSLKISGASMVGICFQKHGVIVDRKVDTRLQHCGHLDTCACPRGVINKRSTYAMGEEPPGEEPPGKGPLKELKEVRQRLTKLLLGS